jgi:hypothetical protein
MADTASVKIQDVSYARCGDVAVAYQVVADGPVDIVFVGGTAGDLRATWG